MGNTAVLIDLMLGWALKAAEIGTLLQKTQAEGREPTDDELNALFASDDAARVALQAKIDAARAPAPNVAGGPGEPP
jgi:hypothetical protein